MPAMPPIISPPLAKMARPSEATSIASTMPCTSSATEWRSAFSSAGVPATSGGGVSGPAVTRWPSASSHGAGPWDWRDIQVGALRVGSGIRHDLHDSCR
ncbi:hypothetical protein D3C71_1694070 [compost metagenome]